MRPGHVSGNASEGSASKLSATDQPTTTPLPPSHPPPGRTTYFLTRDINSSSGHNDRSDSSRPTAGAVPTLQDFLDDAEPSSKRPRVLEARRRSTIKPVHYEPSRRTSTPESLSQRQEEPERSVTPSPLPSHLSLPDSPKSTSSRSIQKSDDELVSTDGSSQAIASSDEDEETEPPAMVQDSQPELIMPSIKMPSRRPFTDRGQRIGKFKILVAGRKGKFSFEAMMPSSDVYKVQARRP